MENNYIILLPPSEGKNEGGEKPYSLVKNNFLQQEREFLLNAILCFLQNSAPLDFKKLFEVKTESLALKAKNLILNHNTEPSLQAIQRYSGIMFKHFEYSSLSSLQMQNAQNSILFIDALFGILKLNDLIPNYKLSISAKLPSSPKQSKIDIAKYWQTNLTKPLSHIFNNKIILDLLPQSHREVIDNNLICKHKYYKINFYETKNGEPKNSGHNSKKLKGELIRHLISFDKLTLQDVKNFKHSSGFEFSPSLSKGNEIVFLK